jgi:hypothetical protein
VQIAVPVAIATSVLFCCCFASARSHMRNVEQRDMAASVQANAERGLDPVSQWRAPLIRPWLGRLPCLGCLLLRPLARLAVQPADIGLEGVVLQE